MTDTRDLKIALLKAQLERALRYDPEWGVAPEDRPLTFLTGVERRAAGDVDPFAVELMMAAWDRFSDSIAMMSRLRASNVHSGGRSIIVPLTYKEE